MPLAASPKRQSLVQILVHRSDMLGWNRRMERIGKCGIQNEQNTFVRSCVLNGSNHRLTHFWPLGTNNAREIGDERPDPSDRLWALFDIANLGRDLALVSAGCAHADFSND